MAKTHPQHPDLLEPLHELLRCWRLNARCGRALVRSMKRDGMTNAATRCELFLVAHDRDIRELAATLRRVTPRRRKR